MTHKTVDSWKWSRGSDPVNTDIPDWVVSTVLAIIGLSVIGGVGYWFKKTAQDGQTQTGQELKTEKIVQRQEIINNDTAYIMIYRNTYTR